MMELRNMKMLLSLGILFFLLHNGLGAPTRGRYMWLKCNPNGQDPNCVKQKGPLMDISGLPDRLPASAVQYLTNKNSALELEEPMKVVEEEPEMEGPEEEPEEEEEEQDDEVYEDDPEADDDEQEEEEEEEEEGEEEEEEEEEEEPFPELPQPVEEEQSGEGSAAGPFLNDQGSGEQGLDYSSYASPQKVQLMPPVKEMKEEHLIL